MHFNSFVTIATLIASVVAIPAVPCTSSTAALPAKTATPKTQYYRIKVLSAQPGNNEAFDKAIQGTFVIPSPGFSGNNVGVATTDPKKYARLTLVNNNKAIKFVSHQSLILDPITSGSSALMRFDAGSNHNGVKPVPYRGTYLLVGTAKTFDSFIVCLSQYGSFVEWVDHSYNATAANQGVFPCGLVELQVEKF